MIKQKIYLSHIFNLSNNSHHLILNALLPTLNQLKHFMSIQKTFFKVDAKLISHNSHVLNGHRKSTLFVQNTQFIHSIHHVQESVCLNDGQNCLTVS